MNEYLNWVERWNRMKLRKELKELRKEGIYCFIEGEVIKRKGTIKERREKVEEKE